MAPSDDVFTRLKASVQTREMTQSLYRRASQLTKHGSGRELGQGYSALFVICAFIASNNLGNGEVTRVQACAAACVDPKTFDATLSIVESALIAAPSTPRRNQTNITYQTLLKQYVTREDAFVPMVEVENALKDCEEPVAGSPVDLGSALMQCAIFFWVCNAILRVPIPDAAHFQQILKVSPNKWSFSLRVLERHCCHMVDDLSRKANAALSARITRSQTRTRAKERAQAALTDLMTLPGDLSVPLTPKSLIKRKTPVEVESKENESPSKRPKVWSYAPSRLEQGLSTHTPKSRRANATSLPMPQSTGMQEGECTVDETSNETIVVRSTTSSQKRIDHKAWDLQRPKTSAFGYEPITPTSSIQSTTTAGTLAPSTTPRTSIGMSDASSPSSLSHSRAGVRTRYHMPSAAKKLSCSIQDEISRPRRRSLRATFLDPSVYGWKPGGYTARKLERARVWESLMIEKYGDPWDAS